MVIQRDGKCVECGTTQQLTVDHIIPRSRGGLDILANLQTLCERCNQRKGSRITWRWLQRLTMALHVDELVNNERNERKGHVTSITGILRSEMQSVCDKNSVALRRQLDGQAATIAFLTKQIRALEAHNKVRWVEEHFEGYKKAS